MEQKRKIVVGVYKSLIIWKIPNGIDLNDLDTYEYGDKWNTLYITYKKTGEEWKIKGTSFEHDYKRANELKVEDAQSCDELEVEDAQSCDESDDEN